MLPRRSTSRFSHTTLGTGQGNDCLAPTLHNYRSPDPGQSPGVAPAPYLFVPDLQGLAADAIEDGEEAALEGVFEHLAGGLTLGRAGATQIWSPSGEGRSRGRLWIKQGMLRC